MKFFKLTKKWQNHVWKERYNCVNVSIEKERKFDKHKSKLNVRSNKSAWLEREDSETDVESDDEVFCEEDEPSVNNTICNVEHYTNVNSRIAYNSQIVKSCDYYEFSIVLQNVRGLKDDVKLEGIINSMIDNNVDAFLL